MEGTPITVFGTGKNVNVAAAPEVLFNVSPPATNPVPALFVSYVIATALAFAARRRKAEPTKVAVWKKRFTCTKDVLL